MSGHDPEFLLKKLKKVKAVYRASWETHLRGTGRLNPANRVGTRFTYPGGMEG